MSAIIGTPGSDNINGSNEDDFVQGGSGDDSISSDGGDDLVQGNSGFDLINAGKGNDTVYGGTQNDTVSGDKGSDLLYGNGNDDLLTGGKDKDTLLGGYGEDTLDGGSNRDVLYGGIDDDLLTGGNDKDTFRIGFAPGEAVPADAIDQLGVDTITDFNPGQDVIELDTRVLTELTDTLRAEFNNASSLASADQNAVLIYDRSTGLVYYNEDASVKGDEKAILQLDPGKKGIDANDFGTF
jgi:Ca2+-binding RTX toxin-like protein